MVEINPDDLDQAVTESYGTGVKELPGYNNILVRKLLVEMLMLNGN